MRWVIFNFPVRVFRFVFPDLQVSRWRTTRLQLCKESESSFPLSENSLRSVHSSVPMADNSNHPVITYNSASEKLRQIEYFGVDTIGRWIIMWMSWKLVLANVSIKEEARFENFSSFLTTFSYQRNQILLEISVFFCDSALIWVILMIKCRYKIV